LYLAGDDAAALARFREYRDRLVHEIDAPPSAAMLELVRRIERAAQRPRRRAATDFSPAAPSFEASLIGRESQWRTLMEVWDAVTRDAGRVVVIEGEAGVGKTRLAEDFSRWALTVGATVLRGRGYDAQTGLPYGPCLAAVPVAVVATLTLGEFERDAPVARLARALRTHAHATVVALAPLTKDEVWLLIRELGRISAPTGGRRFAERVHEVTDGNPFHVVELI